MCQIIFIAFVSVLYCSPALCAVEEEWTLFKQNFHKDYNETEETIHFNNFKENLEEISRHNELYDEGKVTYKKGITKFADLSGDDFMKIYMFSRVGKMLRYNSTNETENVGTNETEHWDWREKGAVTRVKDQGKCGACWIFCAVGVLEGYYFLKTNKSVTFSEQSLVDCLRSRHDNCQGGWPLVVFEYLRWQNYEINIEDEYPYKALTGKCHSDKSKRVQVNFTRYINEEEKEDAIKKAVTVYGPMLVSVAVNENWRLYSGGVWYEEECSEMQNHGILLIGYGRENGQDYWLLKNSWSKDWGERGYMKFARNKHHNYCGFTEHAYYLI